MKSRSSIDMEINTIMKRKSLYECWQGEKGCPCIGLS